MMWVFALKRFRKMFYIYMYIYVDICIYICIHIYESANDEINGQNVNR